MQLTFWWDNMDVEEWDSTYLPFPDGYVLQGEMLILNDFENEGIRLWRGYYNNEGKEKPLFPDPIVLVPPEKIPHLKYMVRNGVTLLANNGLGGLANMVIGRADADEMPYQDQRIIDAQTGEILDAVDLAAAGMEIERFDETELLESTIDDLFGSMAPVPQDEVQES